MKSLKQQTREHAARVWHDALCVDAACGNVSKIGCDICGDESQTVEIDLTYYCLHCWVQTQTDERG